MTKLLAVSPIPWDATSFYRSSGVLHNLARKIDLSFDQYAGRRFTWSELGAYNIVFFQRPAKQEDLKLAEYAKNLGAKIWVDFDDNLFALPYESRAYLEYRSNEVKKTMLQMLLIADAVSVSTVELKDFFVEMKIDEKKIEVVPNALNIDFHQLTPAESFNADSPVIVWRGSETHWFDIECFSPDIYEAMKDSSDLWHFIGWPPASLMYSDAMAKIVVHKGEDIIVYNEKLKAIKPRIMHVPLVENQLNKAKSNIAWIEATCAGAVTIAPNWPEWNRPGVICYDTPEDYTALLKTQSLDLAKCWKDSMAYIKENLLLDYVNQKRVDIVNRLMDKPVRRDITTKDFVGTLQETQTE